MRKGGADWEVVAILIGLVVLILFAVYFLPLLTHTANATTTPVENAAKNVITP